MGGVGDSAPSSEHGGADIESSGWDSMSEAGQSYQGDGASSKGYGK